jgi:hypothetical protein
MALIRGFMVWRMATSFVLSAEMDVPDSAMALGRGFEGRHLRLTHTLPLRHSRHVLNIFLTQIRQYVTGS